MRFALRPDLSLCVVTANDPPQEPADPALAGTANLIYEEARRQIVRQEANLDGMRARATTLLSASGLVNSLFGVHVDLSKAPDWRLALYAFALFAFALMTATTIWIVWPRTWRFREDAEDWLADLKAGKTHGMRPFDYYSNLAHAFDSALGQNKTKIDGLTKGYAACCLLLGLDVVAWGLSLI